MKAIFVHANGDVTRGESLGGKYQHVEVMTPDGPVTRVYECHWAHNANTKVDGQRLEHAWGEPNEGTLVFVEKSG